MVDDLESLIHVHHSPNSDDTYEVWRPKPFSMVLLASGPCVFRNLHKQREMASSGKIACTAEDTNTESQKGVLGTSPLQAAHEGSQRQGSVVSLWCLLGNEGTSSRDYHMVLHRGCCRDYLGTAVGIMQALL